MPWRSTRDETLFSGTLELDGYLISERLLEGVIFLIDIKDGNVLNVRVHPEHKGYFEKFNTEKYLKEVHEYLFDRDVLGEHNNLEHEVYQEDN